MVSWKKKKRVRIKIRTQADTINTDVGLASLKTDNQPKNFIRMGIVICDTQEKML